MRLLKYYHLSLNKTEVLACAPGPLIPFLVFFPKLKCLLVPPRVKLFVYELGAVHYIRIFSFSDCFV